MRPVRGIRVLDARGKAIGKLEDDPAVSKRHYAAYARSKNMERLGVRNELDGF